MTICTKCKYNGKKDSHCLLCQQPEQYSYRYQKYVIDESRIVEEKSEIAPPMKSISLEAEQVFKNKLIELFNMSPNELLLLLAIIQGKSLTEFADEMKSMSEDNKLFTRQRAYETRKGMMTKLEWLKEALLTQGQRKLLKGRSK